MESFSKINTPDTKCPRCSFGDMIQLNFSGDTMCDNCGFVFGKYKITVSGSSNNDSEVEDFKKQTKELLSSCKKLFEQEDHTLKTWHDEKERVMKEIEEVLK